MGGQFTPFDPQRCFHYAQFMAYLDRVDFDGLYWILFFCVIAILFFASWIYQWTMLYKDKPGFDEAMFRRKLKQTMIYTTALFCLAAVMLVIEVFALLALQFCDGEDLMSLYWATWTMLQLGSEIAILGIVLALWHQICDIRHPLWALALGTPVLVVAGFGHVIAVCVESIWKKTKAKRKASTAGSQGRQASPQSVVSEKVPASSVTSMKQPIQEERSRQASVVEMGERILFEIDVGDHNEYVRQWPAFVGLINGRAYVQAFMRREEDILRQLESGQAGPSSRGGR